ncbi:MAG: M1 family metallopeptidase [Gemmatimonadota bacterium]
MRMLGNIQARTIWRGASAAMLLLAALGSAPAALAQTTAGDLPTGFDVANGEGLVVDYPSFAPVEPIAGYQTAVENGTRTEDGRPGESYWQNRVDYTIWTRIDPASAQLTGRETITVHNNSPNTMPVLVLHLYQNVFADGAERNRPVGLTGGMTIKRVSAAGVELSELDFSGFRQQQRLQEREGGYVINGTIAYVLPPTTLAAGASQELEIEWEFTVSGGGGMRHGHLNNEIFNLAQWYPQIAVYDDVYGQDQSPYLGDGEFYTEYGDFDVTIEVPAGWLVMGTGELHNPVEVLRPETLERLAAAAVSDTVVRIVTEEDRAAGNATAAGTGGSLNWQFRAENVRDFAFAAGGTYVWDATSAETASEEQPDRRALIHNLYDPSDATWHEATLYAKHSIEFFSDYVLPYPYPHATAAFGPPQVGGMEYPMITFINGNRSSSSLQNVVIHELSHFWMPMIVGTKEMAFAWMDEGLTNFNESLARQDYHGNEQARTEDRDRYLTLARIGGEAPLMEHTDYVEGGFARGIAAYTKPATLMHSLRHMMGPESFDEAYRDYAATWAYKHPLPWDFFGIMEEHAGVDLDWFWQSWFYGTGAMDQSIESVETGAGGVTITIANEGKGVMPIELHMEMADGSKTVMVWPVSAWARTKTVTRTLAVSEDVVSVVIDPDMYYPDVDRSNNEWKAEPEAEGEQRT